MDKEQIFNAIEAGDIAQLEAIIDKTPELARTSFNASGVSPIMYSLYMGKRDLLPVLLRAGKPLDIFEASALGEIARVKELLAGDKALAKAYSGDGFTALHFVAFFSGELEVAKLLLENGAEVNAVSKNPMKVMPLHSALAVLSRAVVHILIENGAEVNAKQEGSFTPLHEAADHGDLEMVELLLQNGADASVKLDDGRTAYDLATAKGHALVAQKLKVRL